MYLFFLQKLNKDIIHGLKSETNGEKTNGEKINGEKSNGEKSNGEKSNGEKSNGEKSNGEKSNGEKSNGEKSNGEKTNGEKTNGEKGEHSPPPVKKEKDSSLADIEEAIPDVTMDQKNIDKLLDKTRSVYKLYVTFFSNRWFAINL